MKKYIKSSNIEAIDNIEAAEPIMGMGNLLGKTVKVPKPLPFSFYFSTNFDVHGIRVKPLFDPEKMSIDRAGNLWLCDSWEYTPGKDDKHVDSKDIRKMKAFFRKYKVLFCAVWGKILQETYVEDYFKKRMSFKSLLKQFDCYQEYKDDMGDIDSIEELEEFVRENNICNMYDG